jgi:hypothetical protein
MSARLIKVCALVLGLAAPMTAVACLNPDKEDDCQYTYSCPPPDAGDGGDSSTDAHDLGDH